MINNQSNATFAVRAVISSILLIALIVGIVYMGNILGDNDDRYGDVQLTTDRVDFVEPATKFKFDFSAGTIKVLTTTGTPYIEVSGDDYLAISHRYNNGEYTVSTTSNGRGISSFFNRLFRGSFNAYIDVYLPESMLDNVTINVSAGSVLIDGISTDNAKIDVSAGKVEVEKSSIKNLKTDLSAGKLEIDVMSNIESIDASISAGKMDLNLPSDIGSFDLYYDKTAGTIDDDTDFKLSGDENDNVFHSSGKKSYRNGNGEPIQIKLDISAGTINIDDYN